MLDHEALALIGLGYFKYYCVGLYCPDHGAIRCAISYEPEERHPCPVCSRACPCGFLGRGYTRREVPFFERIMAPVPLAWLPADDEPETIALPAEIVAALAAGASYPRVAEQFQISEKGALQIRKTSGLPGRQVHAR